MFKIDSRESLREALIKTTERLGVFVGTDRLDYLENLWSGWGLVAPIYPWDCDYEIQEWIFLRESVSINSGSIHGRYLVPRCYGNNIEAINQYRNLLKSVAFCSMEEKRPGNAISNQLIGISSSFEEDGYDFFAHQAPAEIKQFAKALVSEAKPNYESIIPIIRYMIGENYDDLWVYLHLEACFLCVKFLYHTEQGGWKENVVLVGKENYLQCLLTLHARIVFVQKNLGEGCLNQIITLRHHQGHITVVCKRADNVWDSICDYYENRPFCETYAEWKNARMLNDV